MYVPFFLFPLINCWYLLQDIIDGTRMIVFTQLSSLIWSENLDVASVTDAQKRVILRQEFAR